MRTAVYLVGVGSMILFHVLMPIFPPPPRLFDLYWAINNAMSFSFFAFISLYLHSLMYQNSKTTQVKSKQQ